MRRLLEEHESLWVLTISPVIWAMHFLVSYGTAAIWCAKAAGPAGSLWPVRAAIAAYTVVALIGIGINGWIGHRRHTFGGTETVPHDFDSREDRHRFLGFATLLLAGLSAVGTLYAALVAAFIQRC